MSGWAALDLSQATIVSTASEGVVRKAAEMLQVELAKRSGITLPVAETAPDRGAAIIVGTVITVPEVRVPDAAESYTIDIDGSTVRLVGRDARGAMMAAGRLVRVADYGPGGLTITLRRPLSASPDVPYRAHQLAYRNTANTYDAWSVDTYEQYVRDLIIFGANGVELIPNPDLEAKDGPVMAEPMEVMNRKLSAMLGSYGIDVWLWSPVMDREEENITTPEGFNKALEQRKAMFAAYPVIDHVFVPGGDDGDAPAEALMPFLKALSGVLKETHSNAKLWVSNQTFTIEENNYFFDYLEKEAKGWLTGVVYGPWTKMGWEEMRARVPQDYPIRRYPDINHTVRCQYPVWNWDPAFANTVGREPMMPMPQAQRHIYLRYKDYSNGYGTYSDGVHDDLNKALWSALGWEPQLDLDTFLKEYGKVWWGEALSDDVARGLAMLEENWKGPILENKVIPKSLALWESIAKQCADFETNWRAQMYLFRARFDAYVQEKARAEGEFEREALAALSTAQSAGVASAIEAARGALAKADQPIAPELRAGIEALGPMLLKSIGYQLSVKEPYKARNPERGAMLDWLDQPVNDRPWLEQRFDLILSMSDVHEQLKAIDEIVHWTDPGPGGFYDNLGAVGQFSHVVYQKTWEEDPSACNSPRVEFSTYKADKEAIAQANVPAEEANATFKSEKVPVDPSRKRQELRMSWQASMVTNYGTPLKLQYKNLDPKATYRLKVTYAGRYQPTMTLTLNDTYSVHGPVKQPSPIWPVEYYVPHEATKDGTLDVEWNLVDGRGCSVAEVWLIKEPSQSN